MDVLSLYNKLLDELASRSLNQLVTVAAQHLNQHVVVLDTSYKVLASYPQEPIGDIYWDSQQKYGFVPEDNLSMIFENKYPDATFKGTVYIDWGNISYPRAVSSIQYKGRSLGHVSIYHTDMSVSKEDIVEACECIDRVLRVYFINSSGLNLINNAVSSALLSKIFLGQKITPVMMAQWESAVGTKLTGKYLVIAIADKDLKFDKVNIFLGFVRNFHRYVDSAEIDNYQYFLFYSIPSENYFASVLTHLHNLLKSYKVSAGVSGLFSDLADINSYMFQSRKALEKGTALKPGVTLYHYADLLSDIMLSYIADALDSNNAVHPLLRELRECDKLNGSQYYETLITYLNCMCDSALSAKMLYIHRNTLLYRINHIQDHYGISFADTDLMRSLAISAYVCSYQSRYGVCENSQDEA